VFEGFSELVGLAALLLAGKLIGPSLSLTFCRKLFFVIEFLSYFFNYLI
jgi:hypothetical protein